MKNDNEVTLADGADEELPKADGAPKLGGVEDLKALNERMFYVRQHQWDDVRRQSQRYQQLMARFDRFDDQLNRVAERLRQIDANLRGQSDE